MTYKKILLLFFVMASFVSGYSQTKQIIDKNPTQQQRQDTLKKMLTIKSEPVIIDTLTNLSLRFKPFKKEAHASYYHNKFNGKRTASGKKFSNDGYTAAHRKFPFGTRLKITNEKSGKFVIVEVTDRGPFSRGREIDLSRRAFMEIADNKNSGTMKVTIEEERK
jgi:rare lipoprotein A